MTDSPKKVGRVTIGIPTRNRSIFAVRAVRSALAQTYVDLEILVSDNCSTDDTVQRIEEIGDPRVVLLKQAQNIGMVGNFNACLTEATGEMFLMLSDDDILEPTAIERLSAPFLNPPNGLAANSIGLSWCPCHIINAASNRLWTTDGGPEIESSLSFILGVFNGIYGPRFCGVMVLTDDAIAVGGYDQKRHGAMCDMGNWSRVALRYSHVVCINQPFACYTMHQMSGTSQAACRDWQHFGENLYEDLVDVLRSRGDVTGEKQLQAASMNHISNTIATILLQTVGKPGQILYTFREIFRSRKYLLTPFVARRVLRDGWKILRLRQRGIRKNPPLA